MEIKLTDREIEALTIAMRFYQDSYFGWGAGEISKETKQDLKALTRIINKIETR